MRDVRSAILIGVTLLAMACSQAPAADRPALGPSGEPSSPVTPSPTSTPSPSPSPSPDEEVFVPGPRASIPHSAPRLARKLVKVTDALEVSIDLWRSGNPSSGHPPRRVTLQGLYQQRIYRLMTREPELARRTMRRLDGALLRFARDVTAAGRGLRKLVTPLKPSATLRTQRPEPAGDLLRYYGRARRRFSVDRFVLAAVNYIESKFGRVRSNSSAGAQGPMQFLPSTWDSYGLGGDIQDPRDAILGAANYLHASGAPSDNRRALYAYNHSEAYVDAVLAYARQMRRDITNYYAMYSWQVFIITTKGDKRLTGPGL